MVLDKIEPVVTEKSAVLKTQHGRWTHDCTTEIIYRQIPLDEQKHGHVNYILNC